VQLLWRIAALVWHAKGYTHTTAADRLEERFGEGNGLGRSRISVLVKTQCEPCPPEVAEFILSNDEETGLKVLDPKRWAKFQRELTAILEESSKAPSAPVDPRAVAKEAASSVMDTVRAWLDTAGSKLEAFATQGSALLSGLASKLDTHGAQLDSQSAKLDAQSAKLDSTANKLDDVNAKLDSNGAKLDKVNAKLDSNGAKLDTLHKTTNNTEALAEVIAAKMDTSEQRRRREHLRLMGAILAVGLLITCVSRSGTASSAPVQNSVTVNVQGAAEVAGRTLPGGVPAGFNFRAFLGALVSPEMGKKAPPEQFIPDKPLPGQKLPPCESRLKEHDISGGCWQRTAEPPPCEMLFRYGDACYRPIAADPSKGVGLVPEAPGQEQHQAQH